MTEQDLDRSYTALCEALARVGQAQAPLFLSMVCLALLSRCQQADDALPLIAQAEHSCGAGEGGHGA